MRQEEFSQKMPGYQTIEPKETEALKLWIREHENLIADKTVTKHNLSSEVADLLDEYDSNNPFFDLSFPDILCTAERLQNKNPSEVYGGENKDSWFDRQSYSTLKTGANHGPSKERVIGLAIGFAFKNPQFTYFVESFGYGFPVDLRDLIVLYFVEKSSDYDTKTQGDRNLVNRNIAKLNSYICQVASEKRIRLQLIDAQKAFTDD